MATVPFGNRYNGPSVGSIGGQSGNYGVRGATLTNANDVTDWIPVDRSCNILVNGGTTYTIEVHRSTTSDFADDLVVDTQDDTERAAVYDFIGPGFVQIKLTAVTGGPVNVRVSAG